MRSIVLIGGSGFVGKHVLNELLKEGVSIYAVRHRSEIPEYENVKIIEGGIKALNSTKLKEINPEYIFHCARPSFSRLRKLGRKIAAKKAYSLNKNLIHQIKKSGIQTKLIFASGSLAYGNHSGLVNEQFPLNPISYSRDYIKGEFPITMEKGSNQLSILTLRLPWMIGDGSWFKWFYKKNIEISAQLPQFGAGKNIMSLMDVEDAARLMVLYARKISKSGVYNVFSPIQLSQAEFIKGVAQVLGGEIVDYKKIYPKLEKAALEAFHSNIQLSSHYLEILNDFPFTSMEETLGKLK